MSQIEIKIKNLFRVFEMFPVIKKLLDPAIKPQQLIDQSIKTVNYFYILTFTL